MVLIIVLYSMGLRVRYSRTYIVNKSPLSPLCEAMNDGIDLDELRKMVRADPELLLLSHPPFGSLPLQHAIVLGRCDEVSVLVELDRVYSKDYLIDMTRYSLEHKKFICARHIANAVPSDAPAEYEMRIKQLGFEYGVSY